MLKTWMGKHFGHRWSRKPPTEEVAPQGRLDHGRLKTLVDFFPIGRKLRYYPDFRKEIVFDTFVVAYCVNGDFLYSGEAIERDFQGYPLVFYTGANEQPVNVADIALFQLLVPDTSDLELKLDYQRRALIGRGQQFKQGNFISLISNVGGKGLLSLDTEVAQQVVLRDGPYARTGMVLLTPYPDTLAVSDQRREARAKTHAPVTVALPEGTVSGPCTIVDMSGGAVRIRVRDRDAAMPEMHNGDEVFLDIDLGAADRHYIVKGSVMKRVPETCVIRLEGLLKNGRIGRFEPLELLELKAGLLNYG